MMKLKVQVALNLRPQLLVPWDGFTLVSSELSQYLELDRLQSLPQESHGQAGLATSTSQSASIGTSQYLITLTKTKIIARSQRWCHHHQHHPWHWHQVKLAC